MHNPCGLCTENFAPAGSRREVKSLKRVSFIRQTLLRDVSGRIDYISKPTRQEHLYATYETDPDPFWNDLANHFNDRSSAEEKVRLVERALAN